MASLEEILQTSPQPLAEHEQVYCYAYDVPCVLRDVYKGNVQPLLQCTKG